MDMPHLNNTTEMATQHSGVAISMLILNDLIVYDRDFVI
jgi:hypothetical protein